MIMLFMFQENEIIASHLEYTTFLLWVKKSSFSVVLGRKYCVFEIFVLLSLVLIIDLNNLAAL